MPESLLPAGAGAFTLAQSETEATRWPLPADLIPAVDLPARCPVDLLPYLAAGLGLEIWHDAWSEATQRRIIADLWRLKRNKTKLKGIAAYLQLEGATLVAARRPRDKFWWSGGQTPEQRAATAAAMPQLRIALTAPAATASRAKKVWGGRFVRQAWRAGAAWRVSDAPARHAARVRYVDRGVATPVSVQGLDGPLGASMRVELRAHESVAKLAWGAGRAWGAAAWRATATRGRVIAITPRRDAIGFAVPAGLAPTTVRPVRVHETVAAPPGKRFWGARAKAGLAWGGPGAYLPGDADRHVYDLVTLFDGARLGPTRQPYSFWGVSRWGRPAYTAELRIDVPHTRPAHQHGYGRPWGRGTWRVSDMSPLWRAVAAVNTAKAFRDTVWIDTRLYEPIRFSPGLRFGDAAFQHFGDLKRLT